MFVVGCLALTALVLAAVAAAGSLTIARQTRQTAEMTRFLAAIPRRCPDCGFDCGFDWDDSRALPGPCSSTHRSMASLLLPSDIA